MAPRVFNKRTDAIPPGAVYVGRPSKWGNPFIVGVHGNRKEVLQQFKGYLLRHPELVILARKELRDKDLVCYCVPPECHADIWLKIAASPDREHVEKTLSRVC